MSEDCQQSVEQLEDVPPPTLELLEREITAALYAIWKARGVRKRIVRVDNGNYHALEVLTDDSH